ncbi:MAG TPA: hypothetical protein VIW01_05030 [Dehalococcoidia bacterium]
MKTTAATRPLLLAGLFLALSLVLACGDDDGGDDPSAANNGGDEGIAGYFADIQRIFQNAEDATNEAEETANAGNPEQTLDTRISVMDTYLGEIDTIFNDAISSLEALNVPDSAAESHQDFVDGVRDSIVAANALRDDLTGVTTEAQMESRLVEFNGDIAAAADKADAACLALQEIADGEDLGIDLDCED